jgi:acyl dehydratase
MSGPLFYEDYELDLKLRTHSRTIGLTEITNFVSLAGFWEEIFVSDTAAAKSHFGKRVAPGSLTYVLAEGLVIQLGILEGAGLAFLGVDGMRITKPVGVGDTISVEVTLESKRATKVADRGLVITRHEVFNQHGEIVMEFKIARLIQRRATS